MLISTKTLLEIATAKSFAVGAFNIYNLEGVKAVVQAAEMSESPAMLQMHPASLRYGGSGLVAMCTEAAKSAQVPMSVQLDHSESESAIAFALEAGMSSIMADGSSMPFQENLEFTRKMTELAHAKGAAVEAEIGRISGSEDSLTVTEKEAKMTDPQQAVEFVAATKVDALAVTIGNVHGKYYSKPKLDFDRLAKVRKLIDIPLVLHGASGLPADMIHRSIDLGICKFNVNTEVRATYMESVKTIFTGERSVDLLETMSTAVVAMQAVICTKLRLFGSAGKAGLYI
ncbi:fructose-bisphosphate aldolase [Thalassoporum mexicanum PCC 7367]|uniref:class II fructose-bisphosphate aldolase n=1 Tax=Thalassoporum mexicanum TaxID=3457544 RepID=UPI00029FB40E|nr:class II fructose-bisphosphate aldolase [Pseudanabaena sp. PCC 7367]AFY71478.1 fructose-bisphosphate aldolase [Pseudanabaena sp. PCC 7367]